MIPPAFLSSLSFSVFSVHLIRFSFCTQVLTLSVGQFVYPIVGPFGGLVRNAPIDMWKLTNAHRYLDQERLSLTLSVCRSEFVCLLIARSGHWNSRHFFLFSRLKRGHSARLEAKDFVTEICLFFVAIVVVQLLCSQPFPVNKNFFFYIYFYSFFCKVGVIFLGIFTNLVFVAYFVLPLFLYSLLQFILPQDSFFLLFHSP